MAEERLIDDDKDRKYKIRINENGEEELVIAPRGEDEEADEDAIGFEVPEFDTDDEEAAIMTPEQLAARQKAREEEEARRKQKVEAHLSRAKVCLEQGDYEGARFQLNEAGELDGRNGEISVLKVKTLSRNFTDYTMIDECAEAADGVEEFATDEQKAELLALAAPLVERIEKEKKELVALDKENTEKKNERRGVFVARRKKAMIGFVASASPFAAFLVAAIVIGATLMFTREDGLYIILTAVFAALALGAFIATLAFAHKLWEEARNVKLNERNSSTKIGREYEAKKADYDKLTRIYASFNGVLGQEDGQ